MLLAHVPVPVASRLLPALSGGRRVRVELTSQRFEGADIDTSTITRVRTAWAGRISITFQITVKIFVFSEKKRATLGTTLGPDWWP